MRLNRASLQGSVFWMAPEVVKQTAYTKKADIWSVGCLVVEMLTGEHPWPNLTQMQAIFRVSPTRHAASSHCRSWISPLTHLRSVYTADRNGSATYEPLRHLCRSGGLSGYLVLDRSRETTDGKGIVGSSFLGQGVTQPSEWDGSLRLGADEALNRTGSHISFRPSTAGCKVVCSSVAS